MFCKSRKNSKIKKIVLTDYPGFIFNSFLKATEQMKDSKQANFSGFVKIIFMADIFLAKKCIFVKSVIRNSYG